MTKPSIFLATPNYKPWYHREYMIGALLATHAFPGLLQDDEGMFPNLEEGLYVCDRRDVLTHRFLQSVADYLLFIDSDMGWRPGHVQALLDADVDVISGRYFWKDDRALLVGIPIGGTGGDLQEAWSLGAGFLLAKRSAVLKACSMVADRRDLRRMYPGIVGVVDGVWQPFWTAGERPVKDDGAFSRHCRAAGVKMWIHNGVTLPHFGEKGFCGEPVPWNGVQTLIPDVVMSEEREREVSAQLKEPIHLHT